MTKHQVKSIIQTKQNHACYKYVCFSNIKYILVQIIAYVPVYLHNVDVSICGSQLIITIPHRHTTIVGGRGDQSSL